MSGITTHVLDTSLGRPAAGVPIVLELADGDSWTEIGGGTTDGDGRLPDLTAPAIEVGTYRISFDTGTYFRADGRDSFYPVVRVVFHIANAEQHYHVPLLLSPFSYSTYRGS